MRVFIAITPPAEMKSKIGETASALAKKFPSVKWDDPEKLHLTLAFLGMLAEDKVNALKDTLREVARDHKSFELGVGELFYFYKKHDDSIVYLDVSDKTGELKDFYRDLRKKLLDKDIFLAERLDPHITIGRVKRVRHQHEVKEILVDIAKAEVEPVGDFTVTAVNLYHSMFSKINNTSNYRLLQSAHLQESDESPA